MLRAKIWALDITCANRYLGTKKRYMKRKIWSKTQRRKHISTAISHVVIFSLYLLAHVMSRVQILARKHEYNN